MTMKGWKQGSSQPPTLWEIVTAAVCFLLALPFLIALVILLTSVVLALSLIMLAQYLLSLVPDQPAKPPRH